MCVSAYQHINISSAVLYLPSYLTQVSGEWVAGPVWRDNTHVKHLRTLALAVLVGVMDRRL